LLNESIIQQNLKSAAFNKPICIHVLDSVDSTNRFMKDLPANDTIEVCCAETQTRGRGRFGRSWHSPFGENIYFSLRWHFGCDMSQLSGLGLVVSMAILAALNDTGICDDVRIKWPNDLIWNNKKLCGSLIEVMRVRDLGADVVIGIGLNVNSSIHELALRDYPCCSLYEITGTRFNRNPLIAKLIIWLDLYLQRFITKGFSSLIPVWQQTDFLHGQQITVSQPAGPLSGQANGVNEAGQLILIDEMNVTHYLSSGDTSLRKIIEQP